MYHISKLSSGYGLNACALFWDDIYSSKYLTTIIYIDATFGFLALLWGSATIGLKLVPKRRCKKETQRRRIHPLSAQIFAATPCTSLIMVLRGFFEPM